MLLKLEDYKSHQGASPGDRFMEIVTGQLSAGTCNLPVSFEDGCIEAVLITQTGGAIGSQVPIGAASTSYTVSNGTIVINGPTAGTQTFTAMIIGRMKQAP